MSAVQIQTLWITPQAVFPCTLQCLYQSRRVPNLSITGIPDSISKVLKQKLDVLLFEFIGKPEGRIHLHFDSYKENASALEIELACLIVILAAQNQTSPKNILAIGSVQLDGRILLSQGSQRTLTSEMRKNNFRFKDKIIISPFKWALEHELSLQIISKPMLQEQIIDVINFGAAFSPSEKEEVAQGHVLGKDWFETLPPFQKKAATLSLTGWHSVLLVGAPGTGKSHFAQGLGQMLCDLRRLSHPKLPPPLVIQPNSQCTPEHLVFGYRTKNVAGSWDEAKNGILWLDEVTEFRRQSLEALRVPLDAYEDSSPRLLILTSNPCPCGFWNHPYIPCRCQHKERHHYVRKLSGPLIDRISMSFSPEHEVISSIPTFSSYHEQLQLIANAQEKMQKEMKDPHFSSQWASTDKILTIFQKWLGPTHDIMISQRRLWQIKRRWITLRALGVKNSEQESWKESVRWDCQQNLNSWWGLEPASFVKKNFAPPIRN